MLHVQIPPTLRCLQFPDSISFLFFFFFKLGYSCFTVMYNKVNQLYRHIYSQPLPPTPSPSRSTTEPPGELATQRETKQLFPTRCLSYPWQCIYVNPNLPIHPTPPFPPDSVCLK